MNHEQWEALKGATKGHTLRRWRVEWFDMEGGGYYVIVGDGGENPARQALAAAAPDLLAEVERLRGWVAHIRKTAGRWTNPLQALETCDDALNGAEVPE